MPYSSGSYAISPENMSYDPSGRLRVSNISTLGDYKRIFDNLPLMFDFAGTGKHNYSSPEGADILSVDAGEYAVLQSKMWHNYRSGKPQNVEFTMSKFHLEDGVTKRAGYFSTSIVASYTAAPDGIFLENDGNDYYVQIYRAGNLTKTIPRSDWYDRLDGSGPSGVTINFEFFNVCFMDFLYLGGTSLRCCIIHNGMVIPFCIYHHSNTSITIFIQSPNQPLRFELRSTSGAGSLNVICQSVSSEGLDDPVGVIRAADNDTTAVAAAAIGTVYALKGIRLKATHRAAVINVLNVLTFSSSALDFFYWSLLLNPTVAGAFNYVDIANSALQEATGVTANTVTGGMKLAAGYGVSQVYTSLQDVGNALRLGSTIAGVMDTFVLCITPITINISAYGVINVRELV